MPWKRGKDSYSLSLLYCHYELFQDVCVKNSSKQTIPFKNLTDEKIKPKKGAYDKAL